MSDRSWLPAGFERLGRIQGVPPVQDGSPATLLIEWPGHPHPVMSIAAIKSLRRRHVDLQHAKRTVEHMMMHRKAIIHVPKLECFGTLAAELAAANVTATMLPDEIPDVAAIRARLKMTQEQFAQRYGLELASIRNWEHGRRKPDTAAISYLRVIANDPAAVEQALWGRVAASGIAPQQPS